MGTFPPGPGKPDVFGKGDFTCSSAANAGGQRGVCVRTKAMRGASLTTCFDILHRRANAQEKETPVLPTVCVELS